MGWWWEGRIRGLVGISSGLSEWEGGLSAPRRNAKSENVRSRGCGSGNRKWVRRPSASGPSSLKRARTTTTRTWWDNGGRGRGEGGGEALAGRDGERFRGGDRKCPDMSFRHGQFATRNWMIDSDNAVLGRSARVSVYARSRIMCLTQMFFFFYFLLLLLFL